MRWYRVVLPFLTFLFRAREVRLRALSGVTNDNPVSGVFEQMRRRRPSRAVRDCVSDSEMHHDDDGIPN
jgi:hypothetical protein